MTLDQIEAFKPEVVIVPIGSTEPHGEHLPYCTDTLNARDMAETAAVAANAAGVPVLCYPTLPISLNVNATALPWALSVRSENVYRYAHGSVCTDRIAWRAEDSDC